MVRLGYWYCKGGVYGVPMIFIGFGLGWGVEGCYNYGKVSKETP